MYRFLLTRRWLLLHVAVVVIAVLFVNLGLWQLRRLDERRAANALISQRMSAPPQPLDEVLASGSPEQVAYRRVRVSGSYAPADEVLLSPRSDNEEPGHHVLTPLLSTEGATVVVDRGWVPYELDVPPVAQAAPPDGQVSVTGMLMPDEPAQRSGSRGASDRLSFVSNVDLGRIAPQLSSRPVALWLLLGEQQPQGGELPRPPDPPDLSEGPHLSYAIQWFLFTGVGVFGYPLLIRRSARALAE